jgi:hypothetical protein
LTVMKFFMRGENAGLTKGQGVLYEYNGL